MAFLSDAVPGGAAFVSQGMAGPNSVPDAEAEDSLLVAGMNFFRGDADPSHAAFVSQAMEGWMDGSGFISYSRENHNCQIFKVFKASSGCHGDGTNKSMYDIHTVYRQSKEITLEYIVDEYPNVTKLEKKDQETAQQSFSREQGKS